VTADQRLIREMILQMKTGRLESGYFRAKFGVDILERFGVDFERLAGEGQLSVDGDGVTVTREGLLHVDRLLPTFFELEYQNARYT
jgi:oxygen-independent coproporphyrinogen-3 oxidase